MRAPKSTSEPKSTAMCRKVSTTGSPSELTRPPAMSLLYSNRRRLRRRVTQPNCSFVFGTPPGTLGSFQAGQLSGFARWEALYAGGSRRSARDVSSQ